MGGGIMMNALGMAAAANHNTGGSVLNKIVGADVTAT
jgi:hypothetical protein